MACPFPSRISERNAKTKAIILVIEAKVDRSLTSKKTGRHVRI